MKLNKDQQKAVLRKWKQNNQNMSYIKFRRTVVQGYDCAMVHWCSMWLGIEKDGYIHS